MGIGSSEETKDAVLIIFYIGKFNNIDLARSIEGLGFFKGFSVVVVEKTS